MAQYDLTTLADCKLWLGSTNTNSDTLIGSEITKVSSMIMGWLDGPSFIKKTRTEYYDGKGRSALMLRNFPVLSVSSLTINGTTVPVSPSWPMQAGWFLEPWDGDVPANMQSLLLNGYFYTRGGSNVLVNYTTGYVDTDEGAVVPGTPYQYTPIGPQGLVVADAGVVYASTGIALTPVASAPALGQYVPPNPMAATSPIAYYQFAAADTGAVLNVSYSFIPSAVQMVCTELVGERIEYRGRIGLKSKSLGGQETMAYDINNIPKWAQVALQPFTNVIPLG